MVLLSQRETLDTETTEGFLRFLLDYRMERNTEARSCSRSRCPELLHSDTSMKVSINSTTGTRFELSVPLEETVDGLKRRLAERLRVPKDRLLLLHRDA